MDPWAALRSRHSNLTGSIILPTVPVDIIPPIGSGTFGPGSLILVRATDIVIPGTAHWQFVIYGGPTFEQPLITMQTNPPAQFQASFELFQPGGAISQTTSGWSFTNGEQVRAVARLLDGAVTIAQDTYDTTWYTDSNIGLQIQQAGRIQGGGTGGFTEDDRATLVQANVASQVGLDPIGIGQIIASVANAIERPPLFFTCAQAYSEPLTGRGTLEANWLSTNPLIQGLTWLWQDVPPGAGRRDGFVTRYTSRVLQLVAAYQLDHNLGITVWGEVVEYSVDNVLWIFERPLPSFIGYDIAPGFSVRFAVVNVCL